MLLPKRISTFYSDLGLWEIVRELAYLERTSYSGMVVKLMKEALAERRSKDSEFLKDNKYFNEE